MLDYCDTVVANFLLGTASTRWCVSCLLPPQGRMKKVDSDRDEVAAVVPDDDPATTL